MGAHQLLKHVWQPQAMQSLAAGGAVAMNGLTPDADPAQNGVPLDAAPSIRQGFGRLQLNSSLPLPGINAGFNLQASVFRNNSSIHAAPSI